MKPIIFLLLNFISVLVVAQTTNTDSQSDDEMAIRKVALDYLEGWYSADTARMANALSEDLKKRGFIMNHHTNEEIIADATYPQMITWTGGRENQLATGNIELNVEIIEIGKRIANVKTTTPDFIDYVQLGKINGKWKIYNVVWERRSGE